MNEPMFDPSKYAAMKRKVYAPSEVDRTDLRRVNRVPEKPYSKPEDQSPLLIPKTAFPPTSLSNRPRGNPTPRPSLLAKIGNRTSAVLFVSWWLFWALVIFFLITGGHH